MGQKNKSRHLESLPKHGPKEVSQKCYTQEVKVNYILSTILAILVSGTDLHKHWIATHFLDVYSVIHISTNSDLLKHWRATHILNMCSAILVSGSNLIKC